MFSNPEKIAIPMSVTTQAITTRINAINIPALSIKNSVPNTPIKANTRIARINPISSQIPVFPIICPPPGFCGSVNNEDILYSKK